MKRKTGVLVMSYGTPESLDQIEAYYTHIRRGNPPSPEQLDALKQRYEAIVGGFFPLRKNTDKQVKALEATLNQRCLDAEFVCFQGLKHASPFIENGVRQIVEAGIREAVGIVLAPHYSTMSVGGYIKRAKETADKLGLDMRFVESYHVHPKLIDALSERLENTLNKFPGVNRNEIKVLFSAHSLPAKILELNDPYPEQLLETSRAISNQSGVNNWKFTWQSAGRTAIPWLGPDILETIRTVHQEENVKHIIISPIGFVSDHLEVLYDIDIECRREAQALGMHLERTDSLNTDPRYLEALCDAILSKLERN